MCILPKHNETLQQGNSSGEFHCKIDKKKWFPSMFMSYDLQPQ